MSDADPRVLIVRLGALGDVIHGIPLVAALRAAFPGARIDWVVDPRYVPLLRSVSGLDEAIGLDLRAGVGSVLRTIRELRRRRYSAAIDLQGLLKSALVARLAAAGRTIGFAREHLREAAARWFYTSEVPVRASDHVIRQNLALLSAVGVTTTRVEMPFVVDTDSVLRQVADLCGGRPYAVINPGAGWPNKQWPAERFGLLSKALQERYALTSVVLWGPGEEHLAAAVVAASAGTAVAAPPTTIVGVLSVVKGARLVVSGDTGPVHLAAAVNTPVVGIYGPTNPERNGPWSSADVVVSRYSACSCHYQRRCHMSSRCLDAVSVAEVVDAAARRLTAR